VAFNAAGPPHHHHHNNNNNNSKNNNKYVQLEKRNILQENIIPSTTPKSTIASSPT
jgi:hypothetical protein